MEVFLSLGIGGFRSFLGESGPLSIASGSLTIFFSLGSGISQAAILSCALLRLVFRRRSRTPLTSAMLKDTVVAVGWVFGMISFWKRISD